VGVIPYGVSGSALIRGIGAAAGDWTDRASDPYDTFKTRADAASAAFEYVIWVQGEQDAETGATASHDGYEDALRALITAVRADFANGSDQTNLPFIIAQTGRRTGSANDSDHWEVKSAQLHVADNYADAYMVTTTDATLADAVHYDATFCITLGQRMAQTVNKILGNETYQGRGPKIEGCYLTDLDTIDVKLTHRGGTDITPTSGITGFEVLEDGAAVTVSSVARQDATTVRLTLQSDLTSPDVVVRYQYGADPTVTTPIKDNSGLTLPLELFVLDIDLSNMMYVNLTDGTDNSDQKVTQSGTQVVIGPLNDDFGDGNRNNPPWNLVQGDAAYQVESAGKLVVNITDASQTSGYRNTTASQTIAGDFEIIATFDTFSAGASGDNEAILRYVRFNGQDQVWVSRKRTAGTHQWYTSVKIGNVEQGPWTLATSVTSGKLKIIRSGTTVEAWVYDGVEWSRMAQETGFTTDALQLWLYGSSGSSGTLAVNYSDFAFTSGRFGLSGTATPERTPWKQAAVGTTISPSKFLADEEGSASISWQYCQNGGDWSSTLSRAELASEANYTVTDAERAFRIRPVFSDPADGTAVTVEREAFVGAVGGATVTVRGGRVTINQNSGGRKY
jgi:hypothetical protein